MNPMDTDKDISSPFIKLKPYSRTWNKRKTFKAIIIPRKKENPISIFLSWVSIITNPLGKFILFFF